MGRRVFVMIALAVAMESSAKAEEPDEVTVRGSQAAGFSSRAREGETPREITDAASLVEPLPGVHVRRLGADDSFATLSVRGSSSNEVAVLLAGVPLTGGADPSLDLSSLPLWSGSQARVYRSFAPASLGQGSLGGTLALDPPRVGAPVGTNLWAAAGSFGALRMRASDVRSLPLAGREARLVTGLSASRADDAYSYFDPTASAFVTRENAGHAAINGLVSWSLPLRLAPDRVGSMSVTAMAHARRQELPGTVLAPTRFQRLDTNRELVSVELAIPAGAGFAVARAWGRRELSRLRDDPVEAEQSLSASHTSDAIVAAGAAAGWRGRPTRIVMLDARVDGRGERFVPGEDLGIAQPFGASRASVGGGLDLDVAATRALTLSLSTRLDGWRDEAGDPRATSSSELRPTGHVGAEIAEGAVAVAAHGGYVARPPSFLERYGDRGAFLGDPTLRPEAAWTIDAGARAAHAIGRARLDAELAAFATWADDLIVFVPTGAYGHARATNIGRAELAGAEASARARALGVDLRASYTWLVTANLAECAFGVGACERPALPGRPAHDLIADVAYALGPLQLRYGVDAVAGIATSLDGSVRVPARVLHFAGARLDVPGARGLRVTVDVRNVFDARTATYDGILGPVRWPIGDAYQYPLPGRSVLVSARYALP